MPEINKKEPTKYHTCQRTIMKLGQCFDCFLINVCDDPRGDKASWNFPKPEGGDNED